MQPPAHASPTLSPISGSESLALGDRNVPPSILSPAFTPPTTPGTRALGVPVGTEVAGRTLKLPKELPEVNCVVRARIPT